jgi:hypothetical protein
VDLRPKASAAAASVLSTFGLSFGWTWSIQASGDL